MSKKVIFVLLVFSLVLAACSKPDSSIPSPAAETANPLPQNTEIVTQTSDSGWRTYENKDFGFAFEYPSDWYGPEEYVSDPTLRVEIGSDRVYPYGSDPTTRVYDQTDSYSIVLQYTRNNQNDYYKDTWQALASLKDGESVSDARSRIIRERELSLGRFKGFEFIATLSENAQTEAVYSRQVYLMDSDNNFISILGSPVNVDLADVTDWRTIYSQIDQANREIFDAVLQSIAVN